MQRIQRCKPHNRIISDWCVQEDIKKQYMLLIDRLAEFNYPLKLLSNGDPPSDDDARLATEAQAAEDAVAAAEDAVADAQASGDADALAAAKQALADAEATAQAAKDAVAAAVTKQANLEKCCAAQSDRMLCS